MAHDANRNWSRPGLAAALWLAHAGLACATTLGDIDVRSVPGEPLDAIIALGDSAGGPVATECISVSRGAPEDGPFVTRASVAIFDDRGTRYVRLKSAERVDDRATRLRIVVRCPGQPHVAYREYRALFEPRPVPSVPAAPAGAAMAPVPLAPAVAGQFPVRAGDTLESLAAALLPRNRAAQRNYIEALRERNPPLAALGARDPLPLDATIELPDLRTIARTRAAPEPDTPVAQAPRTAPERPARIAPPKSEAPPAPPKLAAAPPAAKPAAPSKSAPETAKPAPAKSAPAPRPRPSNAGGSFALRLSSSEVDLSRSRGIDDRARARLRERLLVLDNDDQVAALLSLRDSLKRLEGRVAELQLKLSTLPATLPVAEPKAAPKVEAKPAPKVEAKPEPKVEAKPEPKVETAPKVAVAPAPPPKVEAPVKVEPPPPPKVEATPAPVAPTPPKVVAPPVVTETPKQAPKPYSAPRPAPRVEEPGGLSAWLWALVAVLILLAVWLAWRIVRRRSEEASEEDLPDIAATQELVPTEPPVGDLGNLDIDVDEPQAVVVAQSPAAQRREMQSDASLATEVRGADPAALRRRYIEERFPEIANRTIVLADPDSVVKSARLFFEDGAISRAVELLQFATEEKPAEPKPWLALFEIFRLERLSGQFADLAQRFKEHHGRGENWRKVQYFGREIDPGNALYRDLAVGIETIKFEVGKPLPTTSFDPVAENWLNAPMDFENEVLVVELRRALMVQAGLQDDDLIPNPMPALRSVEMFTVA
jgi:phage tail protein X